jgi:protein TonB
MFSTLESAWDRSARRGWSTLVSFGFQAMALSLLLLVPLVWVQGPPKLDLLERMHFLEPPVGTPAPQQPTGERHPIQRSTNLSGEHVIQPSAIPHGIAVLNEEQIAAAPNIDGVPGGTGIASARGRTVWNSIGNNADVAPPPPTPAPTRRLRLSHMDEGSLIYRVQPAYPELARQARIQGTVRLRAVISKMGTIENLQALSGHPTLVPAALNAVRQWRYRPYLLNGDPVEVETEVTVNFILSAD